MKKQIKVIERNIGYVEIEYNGNEDFDKIRELVYEKIDSGDFIINKNDYEIVLMRSENE